MIWFNLFLYSIGIILLEIIWLLFILKHYSVFSLDYLGQKFFNSVPTYWIFLNVHKMRHCNPTQVFTFTSEFVSLQYSKPFRVKLVAFQIQRSIKPAFWQLIRAAHKHNNMNNLKQFSETFFFVLFLFSQTAKLCFSITEANTTVAEKTLFYFSGLPSNRSNRKRSKIYLCCSLHIKPQNW